MQVHPAEAEAVTSPSESLMVQTMEHRIMFTP